MKRIIIKTVLIVGCVAMLIGIFSFVSEKEKKGSLIIKSEQYTGNNNWKNSFIKTYNADGSVEKILLDQKEYSNVSNEKNLEKIIATVRKYEQMGYEITSHTETSTMYYYLRITHTFVLTEK